MEPLFTIHKLGSKDQLAQDGVYSDSNKSTYGPAPVLKPYGVDVDSNEIKTVNVVNDFTWTHAPKLQNQDMFNARYDVPVLDLREQSIQLNPSFNNLARNMFIAGDNINTLFDTYKNINNGYIKAGVAGYLTSKAVTAIPGGSAIAPYAAIGAATTAFLDKDNSVTDYLQERVNEITTSVNETIGGDPSVTRANKFAREGSANGKFGEYNEYLAPYQDIYSTKDTCWRYKIPYMENQQRANQSSWSTKPMMGGQMAESFRDLALTTTAMVSPGVYIDQAKNFVYDGNQKRYTASFPLMNTMSEDDILRNWQLLYLLTYQNRPNRIDRVQLAPPKIYEAMIPGVWWCRHAFIENLTVDFVGNRRKMTLLLPQQSATVSKRLLPVNTKKNKLAGFIDDIFEPVTEFLSRFQSDDNSVSRTTGTRATGGGYMPVTTIIPDAYQVTITLTELVPESQNTMYAAIHKPSTITTSPLDDTPFSTNINISNNEQS